MREKQEDSNRTSYKIRDYMSRIDKVLWCGEEVGTSHQHLKHDWKIFMSLVLVRMISFLRNNYSKQGMSLEATFLTKIDLKLICIICFEVL